MKRGRKTLFALLLALVMTLGLAATAWATGVVPTDTLELTITKIVEQTGDVTPPAETFTFVLEDWVKEGEKHDPAYYGIQLLDDLTISTAAGTGTFEKTFTFKLPASDFERYHWNRIVNAGNELVEYRKTFLLKEQNGDKAGWVYSNQSYYAVFTYNISEEKMCLDVYVSGDATSPAVFTNTYTENLATVEIPFTKTVKLGGNTAPGKTDFTIAVCDVGAHDLSYYPDVTYKVVITTNGAGSYDGKLVISGPADQVGDFICEGFYVREVKGSLSGWKYSDAVWHVMPEYLHESGSPMQIYPTKLEKTPNGEFYVDGETPVDKMTFENIYTRNTSYTTPDEKPISSPKTFDAGVALYGVSALLSLTGTALVIKRKNG